MNTIYGWLFLQGQRWSEKRKEQLVTPILKIAGYRNIKFHKRLLDKVYLSRDSRHLFLKENPGYTFSRKGRWSRDLYIKEELSATATHLTKEGKARYKQEKKAALRVEGLNEYIEKEASQKLGLTHDNWIIFKEKEH